MLLMVVLPVSARTSNESVPGVMQDTDGGYSSDYSLDSTGLLKKGKQVGGGGGKHKKHGAGAGVNLEDEHMQPSIQNACPGGTRSGKGKIYRGDSHSRARAC